METNKKNFIKTEINERFAAALQALAGIPESEILKFHETGRIKILEKEQLFIRQGQVPEKFGFVSSGLFRYVYTDGRGKEFTKAFMPESSFISSYSAMIQHSASHFQIEALERSEILEFEYNSWLRLRQTHGCWDRFLVKLLETGYIVKEKRERELLLLDAEARYRIFTVEYPTLEARVKQHIIASYLGITPESLSRIRKTLPP